MGFVLGGMGALADDGVSRRPEEQAQNEERKQREDASGKDEPDGVADGNPGEDGNREGEEAEPGRGVSGNHLCNIRVAMPAAQKGRRTHATEPSAIPV